MISIVDFGAGNLRSVGNTLTKVGAEFTLIRDAASVRAAGKIVLPGVGHFGQMMRALDGLGIRDALIDAIRAGVPFLGICLGLQALFASSEEAQGVSGLGLYDGEVRRFRGDIRIPHMGWNELSTLRASRLLEGAGPRPYVYFAHSYHAPVVSATAATCEYSLPFTAVLEDGTVSGVQFHPEKSGALGLAIVRNFAEL